MSNRLQREKSRRDKAETRATEQRRLGADMVEYVLQNPRAFMFLTDEEKVRVLETKKARKTTQTSQEQGRKNGDKVKKYE